MTTASPKISFPIGTGPSTAADPTPSSQRAAVWSSQTPVKTHESMLSGTSSPWSTAPASATLAPTPNGRDWGAFPSTSGANRPRSSSIFEEMRQSEAPQHTASPTPSNGSVNGKSKTMSFFDLDLSSGDGSGNHSPSPVPPPNPPSRGNSLKVVADPSPSSSSSRRGPSDSGSVVSSGGGGSWLDRLDASSATMRFGTGPRVRHRERSGESLADDSSGSTEFGARRSPERRAFQELALDDTDGIELAPSPTRPTLPALQTTHLRARVPSTLSPTGRPMTALPTPVDGPVAPASRGARFLHMAKGGASSTLAKPPPIDITAAQQQALSPVLSSSSLSPSKLGAVKPPSPLTPSMEDPPSLIAGDDGDKLAPGDLLGEYRIEKMLGKGAFSRVALGRRTVTDKTSGGELVALKLIAVKSYEGNERMRISVVREVDVLKNIRHPSLVSLSTSFSTPLYTVLVLDYCPGGELFDFLGEWRAHIQAPLARRIFGELCDAVGWMHSIGLVHRDIKLENILLTARPTLTSSSEAVLASLPTPFVKLTDFGLSRFISPTDPTLSTRCGSEAYAAPELIMGKTYDGRKTDAWALGVVLFAIVTGVMPFVANNDASDGAPASSKSRRAFLLKIAKGDYRWPADSGSTGEHADRLATPAVKELVARLLAREPAKRARVDDVWDAEWMRGEGRATRVQGYIVQPALRDGEDDKDGAAPAPPDLRTTWARRGSGLG